MKFKSVDEREFAMLMAARRFRSTRILGYLDEFMLSTDKVVELEWGEDYASAKSCAGAFRVAAKRAHLSVNAMVRRDRVFLIKTEA